jgi:hypothetical protein
MEAADEALTACMAAALVVIYVILLQHRPWTPRTAWTMEMTDGGSQFLLLAAQLVMQPCINLSADQMA